MDLVISERTKQRSSDGALADAGGLNKVLIGGHLSL